MYIENIKKYKIHFLVLIIVKYFVHISQVQPTTKTVCKLQYIHKSLLCQLSNIKNCKTNTTNQNPRGSSFHASPASLAIL